jgi:general stress protein 26
MSEYSSKEKVYEFLQSHAVGILSTATTAGIPSASPIYFIVDEDLNFFFVTKSDTKKAQNVKENKNVALTIVDSGIPLTIQSSGTVEEVQDPQMYAKLAEANAKEKGGFSWPPPLSKLESEGFLLLYKFQPSWLRVGDFSESKEGADIQNNIFHVIIPHN